MDFPIQQPVFESIRMMVFIWAFLMALLGLVTFRLGQNARRFRWRTVWSDEHGANYALQVVLIIPIYAMLMCCALESSFMLVTKVGTVYASYAGARTAVVQYGQKTASDAEEEIENAAKRGMAPFATGLKRHMKGVPLSPPPGLLQYGALYTEIIAVKKLAFANKKTAGPIYLLNKYRYAFHGTDVTSNIPAGQLPPEPDTELEITVNYKYPMNIRLIGMLFGADRENGKYYFPIKTTSKLQYEGPQNDSQTIGIPYGDR